MVSHVQPPGSSIHGILQARILEWVAIPFYSGSSWLKGQTGVSSIAGRFYTVWATREAPQLSVSSVQFSCSVMPDYLRPHGLQHARLPCPSLTSGACSNSGPLSWWCHPIISSSFICCLLLLLPLIFPSIRIFSSESGLHVYNAWIFPMSVLETFESSF